MIPRMPDETQKPAPLPLTFVGYACVLAMALPILPMIYDETIVTAGYGPIDIGYNLMHAHFGLVILGIADRALIECVLRAPADAWLLKLEIEDTLVRAEPIATTVEIALSAASKKILEFANAAADRMKHVHVDTIHILLGLLKNPDTPEARALEAHGAAPTQIEHLLEEHYRREQFE
ncbi:MAG: Clp protease N-terminal domain-containing protein [Candidatus Acidiferrales bacterium]